MTGAGGEASASGRRPLLIVDAAACSGCGLCVVACKDEHVGQAQEPWAAAQPDAGQFWIRLEAVERGRAPRVQVTHLPVACQHCADAPCMAACPEDAILRRPDGLVWIDPAVCTGCGDCVPACPYDAVAVDPEQQVAQKCTGCAHRVDVGLQPRCVEICPHDVFTLAGTEPATPEGPGPVPLLLGSRLQEAVLWSGLPQPYISGCVIDAAADEVVVDGRVVVMDAHGATVAVAVTDAFGQFRVDGLPDAHDYTIRLEHQGRMHVEGPLRLDGWRDLGDISL